MIAATDWGAIATAIALAFIAFMGVWNKRDLSKVHMLVNSQYGESLRIGMVSAKALVKVEPTPQNKKLAQEAEQRYHDHLAKQSAADNVTL